jgi:hypothetical protein
MPPPEIKSFLIADSVFQQANGKWCIIGVFSRIHCFSFPAMHPSLGLFLQMTEVRAGPHTLQVAFVDSQERVLARLPAARLDVKEFQPSQPIAIGVQTSNLLIPAAGVYNFRATFDNQDVVSPMTIEALLLEAPETR